MKDRSPFVFLQPLDFDNTSMSILSLVKKRFMMGHLIKLKYAGKLKSFR